VNGFPKVKWKTDICLTAAPVGGGTKKDNKKELG